MNIALWECFTVRRYVSKAIEDLKIYKKIFGIIRLQIKIKKENRVITSQYTRSVLAVHQTKEKYSSQLNLTNLRRNG